MIKGEGKKIEYEDSEATAKECKKDIKQGPFDVARFVFQPNKSINERIGYFFEDYSLIPKFNFENYPSVRPYKAANNR